MACVIAWRNRRSHFGFEMGSVPRRVTGAFACHKRKSKPVQFWHVYLPDCDVHQHFIRARLSPSLLTLRPIMRRGPVETTAVSSAPCVHCHSDGGSATKASGLAFPFCQPRLWPPFFPPFMPMLLKITTITLFAPVAATTARRVTHVHELQKKLPLQAPNKRLFGERALPSSNRRKTPPPSRAPRCTWPV